MPGLRQRLVALAGARVGESAGDDGTVQVVFEELDQDVVAVHVPRVHRVRVQLRTFSATHRGRAWLPHPAVVHAGSADDHGALDEAGVHALRGPVCHNVAIDGHGRVLHAVREWAPTVLLDVGGHDHAGEDEPVGAPL